MTRLGTALRVAATLGSLACIVIVALPLISRVVPS